MRHRVLLIVFGWIWLVQGGCDPDSRPGIEFIGEGGEPVSFRIASLTPEIEVDLDIEPGKRNFVLDTGSPLHLADVGKYTIPVGLRRVQMDTLGLLFPSTQVVFEDLFADWVPVAGLIGANLLLHFNWELNYPARTITLHAGAFPERDPDDVQVSFMVLGGGRFRLSNGQTVDVGATRHLVYLDIEGRQVLGLLDTGASYMVLKQSLLEALGTEGRPDLGTTEVVTAYGVISAPLTELEDVAFSDAKEATRVSRVLTVVVSDDFLASLRVETGRQVDVLIGGAFLSSFRLRFASKERVMDVGTQAKKSFRMERVPVRLPPVVEAIR